jgi:hypothetical protein
LNHRLTTVLVLLVLTAATLRAEDTEISWSSSSGVALSNDGAPFWMWAGRAGRINMDGSSWWVKPGVMYSNEFDRWLRTEVSVSGVGTVGGDSGRVLPEDLYARVLMGPVSLQAGWWDDRLGETYLPLTSGSMIRSGNAPQLPMVRLATDDYLSLPYVGDYVQLRGGVSHGWMGNDRSTTGALLHEKYGYIRVTPLPQVSMWAGLVHEAMWGGTSPDGEAYPGGFSDFWKVVLIEQGGDDAPTGEQINRLGSHLGIWDFGIDVSLDGWWVRGYYQHYFEAASSSRFNNTIDGLWGVAVGIQQSGVKISGLYELLLTRYQGGDVSHNDGGRQMYYENYMYDNGWTHQDFVMGSSLLTTSGEGDDLRFVNTRVIAHHVGLEVSGIRQWSVRSLLTMSDNYGRYYSNPDPRFDDGSLRQTSFLLEAERENVWRDSFSVAGGLAVDVGEVYDESWGLLLGVSYGW